MLATWQVGQLLWSMMWFFFFFVLIWLVISVFMDIFRIPDLGGWGNALWTLFVIVFPWLLRRERAWFDRWILSRRDFARILTLLVALRALEVARIARAPRAET